MEKIESRDHLFAERGHHTKIKTIRVRGIVDSTSLFIRDFLLPIQLRAEGKEEIVTCHAFLRRWDMDGFLINETMIAFPPFCSATDLYF